MASHVVVRLPSAGTVLGDFLRTHAGSTVTSVAVAPPRGDRVDLLALVEGLPDFAVAQILLAWNLRYGMPAEVLGDPYALRLPVSVSRVLPPPVAEVLRMGGELEVEGNVAKGDWVEQWIRCPDEEAARLVAAQLQGRLAEWPGVHIGLGSPRHHDLECWSLLRMAGEADVATS